jgi:ParD-like antitoxin of type II bacterial toxin-antitoxin system
VSQAVKISAAEMQRLREAAALQSRSISGQAEHWLRLGRAYEREQSYAQVEQALRGLLNPDVLSEVDQALYFEKFYASHHQPCAIEDSFFAAMRQAGVGVGMDDQGNIVEHGS